MSFSCVPYMSLYRYPINMYQPARGYGQKERDKEVPSVRFKIQYQVVSILPLKTYDDFLKVRPVCLMCFCLCLSR